MPPCARSHPATQSTVEWVRVFMLSAGTQQHHHRALRGGMAPGTRRHQITEDGTTCRDERTWRDGRTYVQAVDARHALRRVHVPHLQPLRPSCSGSPQHSRGLAAHAAGTMAVWPPNTLSTTVTLPTRTRFNARVLKRARRRAPTGAHTATKRPTVAAPAQLRVYAPAGVARSLGFLQWSVVRCTRASRRTWSSTSSFSGS